LEDWPEYQTSVVEKISSMMQKENILEQMKEIREIVSRGMEARVESGIKVRQPLKEALVFPVLNSILKNEQFAENIKDELNLKSIIMLSSKNNLTDNIKNKYSRKDTPNLEEFFDKENKEIKLIIDTEITKELKEEGDFREFLRLIQVMRKKKGMNVEENADLKIDLIKENKDFIEKNLSELKRVAGITRVNFSKIDDEEISKINEKEIKKVIADRKRIKNRLL